jgi:hypothetical protein
VSKSDGIAVGTAAAAAIVTLRSTDHATTFVVYTPGTRPGDWQPTPNPVPFDPPAADRLPAALPGWGEVTPFVLRHSGQFEPKGPPRLSGRRYARDYNEMKALGEKNSAIRSAEQSSIARFWYESATAGWNRLARNGCRRAVPRRLGRSAIARDHEPGSSRRSYRELRDEVHVQFLATDHGIRAGDAGGTTIRPAILAGKTCSTRRRSPTTRPCTPCSAARRPRCSAASSKTTTCRSRQRAGRRLPASRALFPASPKRPTRTTSPGFTPAFTLAPRSMTGSNTGRRSVPSRSRTFCDRWMAMSMMIAIAEKRVLPLISAIGLRQRGPFLTESHRAASSDSLSPQLMRHVATARSPEAKTRLGSNSRTSGSHH